MPRPRRRVGVCRPRRRVAVRRRALIVGRERRGQLGRGAVAVADCAGLRRCAGSACGCSADPRKARWSAHAAAAAAAARARRPRAPPSSAASACAPPPLEPPLGGGREFAEHVARRRGRRRAVAPAPSARGRVGLDTRRSVRRRRPRSRRSSAQFWDPPCSRAARPPSRSRAGCRPPPATARGPAPGRGARVARLAAAPVRTSNARLDLPRPSMRKSAFALIAHGVGASARGRLGPPRGARAAPTTRGDDRRVAHLEQHAHGLRASTIDQLRALGDRSPKSLATHAAKPTSTASLGIQRWPIVCARGRRRRRRAPAPATAVTMTRASVADHPHDWDQHRPPEPCSRRALDCGRGAVRSLLRHRRHRAIPPRARAAATLNVCHVLPVSRDFVQRDEAGAVVDAGAAATVNARVAATNRQLDALSGVCASSRTRWTPTTRLYAADGLHLSSAGYERLSSQAARARSRWRRRSRNPPRRQRTPTCPSRAALEQQHAALAEDAATSSPPPTRCVRTCGRTLTNFRCGDRS